METLVSFLDTHELYAPLAQIQSVVFSTTLCMLPL